MIKGLQKTDRLIWSSAIDYEDWRADLEAEHPEMTEEQRMDLAYEINDQYLEDERVNLNIKLSRPILVIADIGRWNGRVPGYKELDGNIERCLYSDCDMNMWWVDKVGDLRCQAVHHDGVNYYLYRTYRDDVSTRQIEDLKWKIFTNTVTRADINRVTRRLGDEIGKVYGWTFPGRPKK